MYLHAEVGVESANRPCYADSVHIRVTRLRTPYAFFTTISGAESTQSENKVKF